MTQPAEAPAKRSSKKALTPKEIWSREFYRRLRLLRNMGVLVGLLLLIAFWDRIVHVVPAGHGGVLFRPITGGVDVSQVYGEGLHITFPWNSLITYDSRIHERTMQVGALALNGLTVELEISVRFLPIRAQLPLLHREIGPDYINKVVVPVVVSAVRDVTGSFNHQQLFLASTAAVEKEFLDEVRQKAPTKHVRFERVLVRKIVLPEQINTAIRNKLQEEERVKEYEFRVKVETLEAARKRVEGKGIQDFQALVQQNLTTKMLYWRGVQATVELAKSDNAKVVVLGTGGGGEGSSGLGLPIILGGWDGQAAPFPDERSVEATVSTSNIVIPNPSLETEYSRPPNQAPVRPGISRPPSLGTPEP